MGGGWGKDVVTETKKLHHPPHQGSMRTKRCEEKCARVWGMLAEQRYETRWGQAERISRGRTDENCATTAG